LSLGGVGDSARISPSQLTEAEVDLTLRLNVLAVLAAIVFVTAVLFGAF
jgi:hypothetical protein